MRSKNLPETETDENVYSQFLEMPRTLHPGPRSAQISAMGKITTHILDIAAGLPAAGVRIRLYQEGNLITETHSNSDGRCEIPLLVAPPSGEYEIIFSIGAYFRGSGIASPFFEEVPVRFLVEAGSSYHVPLVCSPFAYSTYRGS